MLLEFPNDLQLYPAGTTMPLDSGLSPILVKISPYEDWQLSNIIFIAQVFKPLYDLRDGYHGVMQCLHNLEKTLPCKEQILEQLAVLDKEEPETDEGS